MLGIDATQLSVTELLHAVEPGQRDAVEAELKTALSDGEMLDLIIKLASDGPHARSIQLVGRRIATQSAERVLGPTPAARPCRPGPGPVSARQDRISALPFPASPSAKAASSLGRARARRGPKVLETRPLSQ